MRETYKLFGSLLVLVVALALAIFMVFEGTALRMNEFAYVFSPGEAARSGIGDNYRPGNFESRILNSTHVFIVKVLHDQTGVLPQDTSVMRGEIISPVLGLGIDLSAGDTVYLGLVVDRQLKPGNSYLLFAYLFRHPARPYDIFSVDHEHVYKIDHEGNLWRLQDHAREGYIVPFRNARYNQLSNLAAYIGNYAEKNAGKREGNLRDYQEYLDGFMLEPASLEELIQASDTIVVITVNSVEQSPSPSLVRAYYTVKETLKGNLTDPYARLSYLILPADTAVGETYLCFLNGVTLASRFGSFFSADDPEYQPLLEELRGRR